MTRQWKTTLAAVCHNLTIAVSTGLTCFQGRATGRVKLELPGPTASRTVPDLSAVLSEGDQNPGENQRLQVTLFTGTSAYG